MGVATASGLFTMWFQLYSACCTTHEGGMVSAGYAWPNLGRQCSAHGRRGSIDLESRGGRGDAGGEIIGYVVCGGLAHLFSISPACAET